MVCRFGIPRETLRDRVRYYLMYDCVKHDLDPDPETYVDRKIDAMTNSEFLQALSDAIEEIRE